MKSAKLNAARAYAALKSIFALVGVVAVGVLVVLPLRPAAQSAGLPPAFAPVEPSATTPGPVQAVADNATEREQLAVTEFIARRWRIADSVAGQYVSIAYRAGDQHRVEPLLILAVMAIESRYNPVAESVMGAKGLMQVIPKYHQEKLLDHGGEPALLDPEVNIQVGAQILREYQRRFGDTEAALQMYAGAFDEPTSAYANKVFAEKARLEALKVKTRKTGQSV